MTEIQVDAQIATSEEAVVEPHKLTNTKEIIAYLAEKFPLCFVLEGEAKPLKIGLFHDLAEALKDDEIVSKTQLRHALRQYTLNWRYLHGCREGAVRVDLYGNPAGILEAEHVAHAAQQLAEAKAKFSEKRKAELAAKKTQQKRKPSDKMNSAQHGKKQKFKAKPAKVEEVLSVVNFAALYKGSAVKVKVGEQAKKATVLDVLKDSARVQLENGLIINVTPDRLFA